MRDIWFLITDHKGIVKILAILIAIFCVVSIGVSSYTSTMKVQEQQEQQAKKKEKEKQIKNSSVKLKKDQQKTIDEYDDATAQFSALLSSNVWATYSGTGRTLYFTDSSIIIADIHIKYGIEPDRYQLQNEHAAGDKHEKSTKSLAEVATEARESSLVLSQDEDNHDDSGSDIGNSRPIDREYPIGH